MEAPLTTPIYASGITNVRYLRAATLLLMLLFLAVGLIIGVMRVANEYHEAIDGARRSARASAIMAQGTASRTIGESILVLLGVGDVYLTQYAAQNVNVPALNQIMGLRLQQMPHVSDFALLARDGVMIAGASRYIEFSHINSFEAAPELRPAAEFDRTFVGRPFTARPPATNNHWMLPIGVRIGQENSAAFSYGIGVVDTSFLDTLYDALDVGRRGAIALWNIDGQLEAFAGETGVSIGATDPVMRRAFEDMPMDERGVRMVEDGSGTDLEILAVAHIPKSPVYVSVKLNADDYLRTWRGTRSRMILSAVGVVLATLAFAGIILSQLQRARQNEEALRTAKAVAEEANEAKSRFLAHMSHEFRTPLNAIMGFSDIIQTKAMGDPLAPIYATYAGHIYRSGEHLLEIVNDILDMAKIESGVQSLECEPMDITEVVEGAIAFLQGMAAASHLRVKTERTMRLPTIMGDDRFVRQVLINLLSNAIKFSPPGGVVVIRTAFNAEDGIDVSVIDHGPGIEPMIVNRIGEPFLQGNPDLTRAGQGTGLGLSICKHYMALLGGSLIVESALGIGTTVIMRFPHELRVSPSAVKS